MAYSKITIEGFRGFANEQTLKLAIPNGMEGSGLTVLVGPNNAGKTTIYEAMRMLSHPVASSLESEMRNMKTFKMTKFSISDTDNNFLTLRTISNGGSNTEFISNGISPDELKFYTIPSRRTFRPYFNIYPFDRDQYVQNLSLPGIRGEFLNDFGNRLHTIERNFDKFISVFNKVIKEKFVWNIDKFGSENFLNFQFGEFSHSSNGIGDGILNIILIVDALYDSKPGDLIFIDEPELSLHPSYQKNIVQLLLEYSKDRQIIIGTHSNYFVSWEALINGGTLARVTKFSNLGSQIFQLKRETIEEIKSIANEVQKPHILDLKAKEIFFMQDNIILVEGQDDVVYMKRIMELKNLSVNAEFFGWGAGGEGNFSKVIKIFRDLGFMRVLIQFDNNPNDKTFESIGKDLGSYIAYKIPTQDIRDKEASERKDGKKIEGLINGKGTIINELHTDFIDKLFKFYHDYFVDIYPWEFENNQSEDADLVYYYPTLEGIPHNFKTKKSTN